MNKEYYETGKYCTVIGDDGEVRVLSKINQYDRNSGFDELIIRENYLEDAENEKNEIIAKIKELAGWNCFKKSFKVGIVISLFATLLIFAGAIFATLPEVEMLLNSIILRAALFGSVLPISAVLGVALLVKIEDWISIKKLKKRLNEVKKEIKEIQKEIEKAKENIVVEETSIAPTMSKTTARKVNEIIENDETTAKLITQQNERILRNSMNDYLERENIPIEKGKVYSIGSINRRK